jgi:hypothetical protein
MYSTFYEVDLINPAVQGTLGMLKSALKTGYAIATLNICAFLLLTVVKISSATNCYNILLRSNFITTTIQAYCI